MTIIDQEALQERARNLGAFNGLRLVLVGLQPAGAPTEALLQLHLYNDNERQNILDAFGADPTSGPQIFPISGGHRVPAGSAIGQVQVTDIAAGADDHVLELTVAPIGDYSTYVLSVSHPNFDPLLSELPFKFRPGCFSIDCAPDWAPEGPPGENPVIDYLAKDFDSFRHTMIAAMMERVPGWRATSAADFDQTLLELFSAAADELSDYQDRVMNEAYIGSARKRVSLARHARLMDYHLHQGNQASTWLALELQNPADGTLPAGLLAWTGDAEPRDSAQVFMTQEPARLHHRLSRMGLYNWSGAVPSLAAGSTSADLEIPNAILPDIDGLQALINDGEIRYLLIQEWLNPETGLAGGRNPEKRQLLELIPDRAERRSDPLGGPYLHVEWVEADQLKHNYCFLVDTPTGQVDDVSLFHGNLVQASHGRPVETDFFEPEVQLSGETQAHYERTGDGNDRWGTLCRLPLGPLAYRSTPPGGELAPKSTLAVEVELPDGSSDPWDEQINLIHSDDSDENGDHFLVETDEESRSLLRFGNGINGRRLPSGAIVHCRYQVGVGLDGNVGADSLVNLDPSFDPLLDEATVWNPFDVTDGRAPEPTAELIRSAPEAYRARQLRAVTLADYEKRAEELPGVDRAAARYAWTGSWRTVQIAIDPVGTTELDNELREEVARHLEAVRLIGEDLELRPPRFVPLEIHVALCVHPEYWPEDVAFVLRQVFSDGYTPDGQAGFFHPDLWTFGQEIRASQIIGRVHEVEGVEHVISLTMKRFNEATPGTDDHLVLRANEIVLVRNDPDHMERGFIDFDVRGGRQ